MHTTEKGEVARYLTAVHLIKKGAKVSIPMTENCSYDLIADFDNKLYRIQVKKATPRGGVLIVKTSSVSWKHGHSKTYSAKSIDWLISVDIENNKFYLLDYTTGEFDDQTAVSLRLVPSKNKAVKNIRNAIDYELNADIV